jgi:single-strand DNA-binding protein
MNHWTGYGNIGADPEVKTLPSGKKVAKFSMATNKSFTRNGEKVTETQWHQIILWEKLAELAEKYVKKGSSLIIEGEISYRSYENKEGQTVYITEIVGHNMHFTGNKEAKEPVMKIQDDEDWKGKKEVKSMSDINDLPQHVRDAEDIPDEEIPFA